VAEKLLRYWKIDVSWRKTWLYIKPVSDWLLLKRWHAVAVLCWMFVICKAVTCVVMFYYCNVKSNKILGLMSAISHFFTFSLLLLTFFQCQNFKCLLSMFCFAVINSCA
jgi:CDP-diglyceride synthetase